MLPDCNLDQVDFLVIGAGVAGLRAAIELAPHGSVLVVAKDSLRESSSEYAQGGIAAALNDDDEVALHEQDTLYAGDGLCDPRAVHTLVDEGPRAIEELIGWGAEFDREGGKLAFAREGAHSRNRVLHAQGDSTGKEIARTLYLHASSLPTVRFASFSAVVDLILAEGRVVGAVVFEGSSGTTRRIYASSVLLATGGLGRVYLETTNPDVATGDGVAMAWRAGAVIENIEFVQFHPTALYAANAPRFLLSEALRGDGAVLRNDKGEAFMARYHELADLAPRDVVSRAILAEMQLTGASHVWLDMSSRDAEYVRHRFPRIYETCMAYGVDITKSSPVHPAAHYAMGGVKTDLDGRTTVPGLFAAGEAACTGVHGANRLASNSLLEGVVFGRRAGQVMAGEKIRTHSGGEPPAFSAPSLSAEAIRTLAWKSCGISRDEAGLEAAIATLDASTWELPEALTLADIERRNMHEVAALIARMARWREESRGGHYRTDFPDASAQFTIPSQTSIAGRTE
ncbi:MAG: L-aspartate oxidase [Bryobacterales bacterium]|nr:L-aspartate oxidase [Bryobacterales bacterium]